MYRVPISPYPQQHLLLSVVFIINILVGVKSIPFRLAVPPKMDDIEYLFVAHWPFVNLLWRNVCSKPLLMKKKLVKSEGIKRSLWHPKRDFFYQSFQPSSHKHHSYLEDSRTPETSRRHLRPRQLARRWSEGLPIHWDSSPSRMMQATALKQITKPHPSQRTRRHLN